MIPQPDQKSRVAEFQKFKLPSNTFSEGVFNTPPIIKPASNSTVVNAKQICQFNKKFFLSIERNYYATTPISRLFLLCRPLAIFFAVIPVVVNTINSCIFFSKFLVVFQIRFIHVILEFLKRLPQTLNSSTTIKIEVFRMFILTSVIHLSPDFVKTRMRHSMCNFLSLHKFFFKTPATLASSSNDTTLTYCFHNTTIALKNPVITRIVRETNCSQSSESLSSNIFHFIKHKIRMIVQLAVKLPNGFCVAS